MNSFNFQIVQIDTISSIQIPFPEHICYFTEDTDKYYICKDNALKEIFVDTTSLTWSNITNKPTTITGYGITDAVKSNNGTVNYVAKFTPDGTTIGNSQIIDDGNAIAINTTIDSSSKINISNNLPTAIFIDNTYSGSSTIMYVSATTAGPGSKTGHYLEVSDSLEDNFGIISRALGGKKSVAIEATAQNSSIENIGVDATGVGNLNGSEINYGVRAFASAGSKSYGGKFEARNGSIDNVGIWALVTPSSSFGNKYSVRLEDGTEAAGKFLKSVTADGKANWANITASDVQGAVGVVNGTNNYVAKFTPDGTTIGNSLIQDDGDTIGFGISPSPDISYYFSSTNKPVGKWFIHSYTGSDSVVSSDIELSGTISAFSQEAIGYGVTNLLSNLSGNGKNYGIKGTVSGADINIGASFTATGGANAYAIELKDGTQAAGRFLKSVTGDGKANWANITTADIQGYQAPNFSLSESKAIYVDATYGNNTTGTKYDPSKPFLTWSAALAVAIAGDWIVFNAGTYTQPMTPVSNVNVYCKPGVIFSGTGFIVTASTTWKMHGYAIFNNANPLAIESSGATHDIHFEFDRTTGLCSFGFVCSDLSVQMKLTFNCNYLIASTPIRLNNGATGATYDVSINVSQRITGYGSSTIHFPSNFAPGSIFGTVVINAPIIENTNSGTVRTNMWSNMTNTDNFQMFINASVIRISSTSFVDAGMDNIVSAIWYDGGDNININADVDGGVAPAIINRSVSGVYHTGNMTITGNVFSHREIIQQYQKYANGNGWHNIIIRDGFIHSKGIGLSDSMFHRASNWNTTIWGTPGNVQLVNCVIYNQNANASANASIIKDDLYDVGKNNNFQLYNCLAFVETSGYLATSVQATKYISAHNVRTNRPLNTTVTDGFSPSGIIVDTNLTIPKTNINI